MTAELVELVTVLADHGSETGDDPERYKASPLGLLIPLLFLVAVALLVRSMTKHLKRVPASFDNEEDEKDGGEGEEQEER